MNRNMLSFLAWGVGVLLLLTFFWRARLGRNASPTRREADRARKRGLNWILVAALLALVAAALL